MLNLDGDMKADVKCEQAFKVLSRYSGNRILVSVCCSRNGYILAANEDAHIANGTEK